MTRITEFSNPRMAQAFVDYMATQGVRLRIEQQERYTIWLDDHTHAEQVERELNQFIRDPNHSRYLAASWHAGTTNSGLHYPRTSLIRSVFQRAGPLTLTVVFACIVVFVLMQTLGIDTVMPWLAWPQGDQHFQIWRWFTPALLHFSLLHIAFNLMWWWYLGGAIEKRLGAGKLFVILVISVLLSGWMQAKFSGVMFGGLSGAVYALMGYSWLRGLRDPQSGIGLEQGMMAFAIIWLLVGYMGWFGLSVANGAHVTGLLVGLAMAFVDTQQKTA